MAKGWHLSELQPPRRSLFLSPCNKSPAHQVAGRPRPRSYCRCSPQRWVTTENRGHRTFVEPETWPGFQFPAQVQTQGCPEACAPYSSSAQQQPAPRRGSRAASGGPGFGTPSSQPMPATQPPRLTQQGLCNLPEMMTALPVSGKNTCSCTRAAQHGQTPEPWFRKDCFWVNTAGRASFCKRSLTGFLIPQRLSLQKIV